MTAEELKKILNLEPLRCEGGYFTSTYRSSEQISRETLPPRYDSARRFSSAIYYLLTPDTFSALHRLKSDEIYHFYLGDPVTLLLLHADGRSESVVLGQDIKAGQRVQFAVPWECWQGSYLQPGGSFALMGTTVSPAFHDADFELGHRSALVRAYPESRALIERLTRG